MKSTEELEESLAGRCRYARGGWAALLIACCGLMTSAAAEKMELPALTSVSGSPRIPGKFVWADLVTDDAAKAAKFYGTLFSWTFRDVGGYLIGANDERPLCGLLQRSRPSGGSGAKPRWIGYLSVNDVDRALRQVTQSGGRVLASRQNFPRRGEQAVVADPEGALFGLVKSASGDPQDFLAEPGDWIWTELVSRDARAAGDFYRKVAGYDVVENTDSPRSGDYVFASKGYARAAALTLPQNQAKVRPSWLLFVRVKSVSHCVQQTPELGGTVLIPPKPDLLEGRVAVLADPTGAAVGIMECKEPASNSPR